jgi:hypothetical protein
MSSLDLQDLAVVRSEICTDTPLVPARLYQPACLRCHTVTPFVLARLPPPACLKHLTVMPFVPARNPPRSCLRCRTVTQSIPTHLSLQQEVVSCVNTLSPHTAPRARKGFLARDAVWRLDFYSDY